MSIKRQAKKQLKLEEELAKQRVAGERAAALKEQARVARIERQHARQAAFDALPPERQRKLSLIAGGVVVAIVLAVMFLVARAASRSGDEHPQSTASADPVPTEVTLGEAQDQCEQFVKKRLKAPKTADFANTRARKLGRRWVVDGQVDAENSFGAPLRSYFECTMRIEGDEWVLEQLTGLQ